MMAPRAVPGPMTSLVDGLTEGLSAIASAEGPVRHVRVHTTIGSTNISALEDGREGLVVLALEQTEGRGRHGNEWASPPGGVYLSYVPTRDLMPARPTDLSILASLAVVDVVEATLRAAGTREPRALLKWPNDVLVSDGKVAGVLVQSRAPSTAVVGVGLNVNVPVLLGGTRREEEWSVGPRSLAEVTGRQLDLGTVAIDLVGSMVGRIAGGLTDGSLEEYRSRCHTLGRRVAFTEAGERTVGTAVDLDPEGGALLVRTEGGEMRRVTSGEVRHIRSVKG